MKSQYKPFFITIICELLLALFFYSTNGLGYETDVLFWNHIYERVFIAIIWPFIALIRNTKEKNTKYLKIALIIIEIYLFLLIFVQDWSNLNKREFFVLYLCILWLIKETIYKRYKKRQKNFFISIYWIVAIFIVYILFCLVSIALLIYQAYHGTISGFETVTTELNQTFRLIVGGYLIKAGSENIVKIGGNYYDNVNKIKIQKMREEQGIDPNTCNDDFNSDTDVNTMENFEPNELS